MFAELEEHERLVQMKENYLAFDPATKKSKRNPTKTTGPNATTSAVLLDTNAGIVDGGDFGIKPVQRLLSAREARAPLLEDTDVRGDDALVHGIGDDAGHAVRKCELGGQLDGLLQVPGAG